MASFIVNESKHVLDMEEKRKTLLKVGERLPNGLVISEMADNGPNYEIYTVEDNSVNILVVKEDIANKWIELGYLPKRVFADYVNTLNEKVCLFFSPSSLILQPLTSVRFYGSKHYAYSVAGAIWNTRVVDQDINLRDSIYCELYSILLPTFTQTRAVCDKALFSNCFLTTGEEDISSPNEVEDSGLSPFNFAKIMQNNGFKSNSIEYYLQAGEKVDDYVMIAENLLIASAVEVTENFQVYNTNSDVKIVLFNKDYADKLIKNDLILQMDLRTVQLGYEVVKAIVLSKRKAVECLDNRQYGITKDGALELAQAIGRTRRKLPKARLDNGLYIQEFGLIFPQEFECEEHQNDARLVEEILYKGPFAMAAFLEEHVDDAKAIVMR